MRIGADSCKTNCHRWNGYCCNDSVLASKNEAKPIKAGETHYHMKNTARNIAQDTSTKQPFTGVFFNIMGSIQQPLLVLDSDMKILNRLIIESGVCLLNFWLVI